MSELDLIKSKIVDTKAKLKKAEAKLEQLEGSEVKNELEIKKWEGRTERLEALLIAQQNEENLILANQGAGASNEAAPPCLVDFLKGRLAGMDTSPPPVVLSPTGGMQGQEDQPFGKTLYGITEVAKDVAELADETFANFAQKKVHPNKVYYVMGALLSGMGTGKSSFLDRHASLIREYCQNEALKKLLAPESRPLVLNVSLSSGTDYSAREGAADSGAVSVARRLVYAYTKAPWNSIRAASANRTSLPAVLELIVGHHRKVCGMTDDQQMVVVLNVDEVNQIHTSLVTTPAYAEVRVREVVTALRQLSMTGVTGAVGVGPAVLCLLASTGTENFRRSMVGSSVEFITRSLPLLTSAEVMTLMKECGVHEGYLSDPSFLQLLEDTAGVPRVLRKVLEGLTMQFAESGIAKARNYALQYIKNSHSGLTTKESDALIPYIVLGFGAPAMQSPLVKQARTTRTFEDLRMTGVLFDDGCRLVMPMLLAETLFLTGGLCETTIGRLVYWYRQRTCEGFEMFTALFHALKMQHLSVQRAEEVSMGDFYRGALMPPEVAALEIRLEKSAEYEVEGQPSGIGTYRFPGTDEAKNREKVGLLKKGAIVLNGKMAPAGGVLLANPLDSDEAGVLVRSLRVAHPAEDRKLDIKEIDGEHTKARDTFAQYPQLFPKMGAAEVVTVHVSNRELHEDAKIPRDGCIVIGRDEIPKFFGPTFQRGLLSPTYAAAARSADSPRAYSSASRAGGSRLTCASGALRPVPALSSRSLTGLRLAHNLVRRLL